MTAAEARAAEVVAAVPQEVFATADVTPALYFAFLGSSLTFAVGTVSNHSPLSPPAITPRDAPQPSRANLHAIVPVAPPAPRRGPLEDTLERRGRDPALDGRARVFFTPHDPSIQSTPSPSSPSTLTPPRPFSPSLFYLSTSPSPRSSSSKRRSVRGFTSARRGSVRDA